MYVANCGYPTLVDDHSLKVVGYNTPLLEGSNITPLSMYLFGPSTFTCMGNGEWEPDLRNVECNGIFLYCINNLFK